MTDESMAPHERLLTDDIRGTVLLTAAFWSCAFIINEGMSALTNELSFELAGGHRAAAFGFGALLALTTANILRQIGPDIRKQITLAAAAIILMPTLHAVFFFLTCKVAPIAGVAPMTARESIVKGLLSTGYFAAWVALQLAVIYHHEARRRCSSARASGTASAPGSRHTDKLYWASWRNQRVCVRADEIRWVEAQKDYAILHCPNRSCIMRTTLTSLAAELPSEDFVRVHRSAIVRRSVIASLHRRQTGALALKTTCGAELPVGRSYATALRELPGREPGRSARRSSQRFDTGRTDEELPVQRH